MQRRERWLATAGYNQGLNIYLSVRVRERSEGALEHGNAVSIEYQRHWFQGLHACGEKEEEEL